MVSELAQVSPMREALQRLREGEDGLDLSFFLRVLRRSWWFLLLGTLLAGAGAYAVTWDQVAPYTSTASVMVIGGNRPGITTGDVAASRALADELTSLIKTNDVMQDVVDELGLAYGVDTLKGKIKARVDVPADADEAVLRPIVLEIEAVKEAIAGKEIKKFIVVTNRLVNIVAV